MWRPGANLNWTETWLCKSFKGTSGDYGNFSIWGVMATYGNFTGSAWQRSEEVSCALCQGDIGTMCLIPQVAWSTRDPVARCSTMFMYSHSLIVWSHVLDCPGTFLHRGFGRFLNFVASLSKSSCWKVPDIPRSMEPPFLSRFVPGVPTGC